MHRLKLPSEEPEEPPVVLPPAPPVVTTPQTPVENSTPVPTRPDPVAAVENNIPTNNVHTPQPSMEPSVSSRSSPESDYSAGMGPGSLTGGGEDESSRGVSSPMTEETSSQPFIGPATQEDHQHTRIGFTGLKLGECGVGCAGFVGSVLAQIGVVTT